MDEHPPASGDAKWDAAVQAVAESRRRVAGMLREGTILSLDEDALVLAFSPERRVFIDQLSDPQVKALIEAQMQTAFGRGMQLQFAVADSSMEQAEEGSAKDSALAEPALRERALADPTVRLATDLFGARLLRVRPVPKGQPTLDERPID